MPALETRIQTAADEALKALEQADQIRDGYDEDEEMSAEDLKAFEAHMEDFSQANQRHEKLKAEKARRDELEDGLKRYGEPTSRPPSGGPGEGDPTPSEEENRAQFASALKRWAAHGPGGLTREESRRYISRLDSEELDQMPREMQALTGEVDSLGGFTVPEDYQAELVRDIAGFAVIRPVARVRRTGSDNANFMTVASGSDPYPSGVSGAWRKQAFVSGGSAPPTQDQPTFGNERVPVHSWIPDVIEIPLELLEDSAVNLEQEIREILAETRALDEDSAFINGSGVGQPEGLLQAGITTVNSGAAGGQSYGGLVDLRQALPAQYRSRPNTRYLMNSLTYGLILKLDDADNNPLFAPNTLPDNLWGNDIMFSEFMPDGDTDGNNAIIYGDFGFYGIADRMDLRFFRLTERYAPNVGLLAFARVGGQALKTVPFRMQNVGA